MNIINGYNLQVGCNETVVSISELLLADLATAYQCGEEPEYIELLVKIKAAIDIILAMEAGEDI